MIRLSPNIQDAMEQASFARAEKAFADSKFRRFGPRFSLRRWWLLLVHFFQPAPQPPEPLKDERESSIMGASSVRDFSPWTDEERAIRARLLGGRIVRAEHAKVPAVEKVTP